MQVNRGTQLFPGCHNKRIELYDASTNLCSDRCGIRNLRVNPDYMTAKWQENDIVAVSLVSECDLLMFTSYYESIILTTCIDTWIFIWPLFIVYLFLIEID